jgi:hypothetical protein
VDAGLGDAAFLNGLGHAISNEEVGPNGGNAEATEHP